MPASSQAPAGSGPFVRCERCGDRLRESEVLVKVTADRYLSGHKVHEPEIRVLGVDPYGNVAWEEVPGTARREPKRWTRWTARL